jgi:hypothetical protein
MMWVVTFHALNGAVSRMAFDRESVAIQVYTSLASAVNCERVELYSAKMEDSKLPDEWRKMYSYDNTNDKETIY